MAVKNMFLLHFYNYDIKSNETKNDVAHSNLCS